MKLAGKVAIVTGPARTSGAASPRGWPTRARRSSAWTESGERAAVRRVDQAAAAARRSASPVTSPTRRRWRRWSPGRARSTAASTSSSTTPGSSAASACSRCRSSAGTRQIAVNLTGTFLCTKHVARLMVERGAKGSIIVIVSTAGHQGQAGNIGYCTSKSGLLNFTRAAAMDLARHGIRVNSLTPYRDRHRGKPGARGRVGPSAARAARGRLLDFQKMVPDGPAAEPAPLRAGRGVPRLGRRGDDHRLRPARRRRRDREVLALDPWLAGCENTRRLGFFSNLLVS